MQKLSSISKRNLCFPCLLLLLIIALSPQCSTAQLMQPLNQPAGPVHPGFQEMPVYGHGPEAELRRELAKKTTNQKTDQSGPFPPDHTYVRPYLGDYDDAPEVSADQNDQQKLHVLVQKFDAFLKLLGNNWLVNFAGNFWHGAKCPEIHWSSVCIVLASLLVVLCGILPALLLPIETGNALHQPAGLRKLKRLLSFAVGSLLGDVFLHILPEAYSDAQFSSLGIGLWIISGLLLCFLVEKICSKSEESQHRVTAAMNLIANLIDNFTHGLAVGGSFLVNIKFGILTTFAILVHEIPHEISDFAILLRADFNRWQAIKAQLVTASGGVLGAVAALWANGDAAMDHRGAWILPFTAGGFLNIALVEILPDLMTEHNGRESIKQLLLLFMGIAVMGILNLVHYLE